MKVLVFGLPGSGKSTLSEPLAEQVEGVWINADAVREKYNDWDFSNEGRMRQAARMRHLADGVSMAGKIAITDFVCPFQKARDEFEPDYVIWMDTIKEGRFEDTNKVFEKPQLLDVNYVVDSFRPQEELKLAPILEKAFSQWQK
jgi:adenylylsulfate kinase